MAGRNGSPLVAKTYGGDPATPQASILAHDVAVDLELHDARYQIDLTIPNRNNSLVSDRGTSLVCSLPHESLQLEQ